MERKLFAGSNTINGFINLFDSAFDTEKLKKIFILTGGSGVGKSSIMKKIISIFNQNREIFYCCGDLDSLDGVILLEKAIGILDGTYPHIRKVKNDKKETIIDLSKCINNNINNQKDSILALQRKSKLWYKNGYDILSNIDKTNKIVYENLFQKIKTNELEKFIKMIKKTNIKDGKKRYLFDGVMSYAGEVYTKKQHKNIISLVGEKPMSYTILNAINKNINGSLEIFYSPLSIDNVSAIGLNNNTLLSSSQVGDIKIDVCEFFDSIIDFSDIYCLEKKVIKKAQDCFINARFYHEQIEFIYRDFINFDLVNEMTFNLIDDIRKI